MDYGAIGFDNINTFKKLHLNSEKRGYDSSGVVIIKNKKVFNFKESIKTSNLWKSKNFKNFLSKLDNKSEPFNKKTLFLGHSRMETNGFSIFAENNQPLIENKTLILHNGILTDNPNYTDFSSSDTRLICKDISKFFNKNYF